MVQHEPYRSILAEQKPFKGVLIPVGLFDDERPMAILLGHILPGENYCLLAGLGADISLMGKGLEKRMEAYLAEKCLGLNIKELRFIYDSDSPGAPVINELLDQCGYSPPEPELLVCRCDKRLANLALMGYTELPAGLDTVNWLQLADEKREAFRTLLPSFPWFEPRLSPFLNDAHICPEPSLAMMKGEEIVGWAICHQTDSDTIDYTTIEIFPEYQGVGTGIALQMRSIRRHLLTELADRFPYGRFVASYKDHARLRVLKKKFLPHAADWHDRMLRTRKL
jgi:hypothetical protein